MRESKRQRGRGTDRYTDRQIVMMIRRNKDLSTNLERKKINNLFLWYQKNRETC